MGFEGLLDEFYHGKLDIARLNYGSITLVPKTNDVKKYRSLDLFVL